jgi:hypothetical protein
MNLCARTELVVSRVLEMLVKVQNLTSGHVLLLNLVLTITKCSIRIPRARARGPKFSIRIPRIRYLEELHYILVYLYR